MATYAIGDIQGCFAPLERLLRRIAFDPERDRLWLVGDLVNRGPDSLAVLRWAMAHDRAVVSVLGNHDLHLLARYAAVIGPSSDETIGPLLSAPDADALVGWLGRRPLLHREAGYVMVHAGLLPSWTVDEAEGLARDIEAELRGPGRPAFLHALYHQRPRRFAWELDPRTRRLVATAVLTRVRTVDAEGQATARFKGPPEEAPPGQTPWFQVPGRASAGTPILFGHWAALGLWVEGDVMALDSGCVWGGSLTALRLEDRAVFAVPRGA